MLRTLVLGVMAAVMAGCATQPSSVQQMGPDTYAVSAPAFNVERGRDAALSAANGHCGSMGRKIMVTNTRLLDHSYELIFICLLPGDPGLTRPRYEIPASTVIEDRRK